MFQNTRYFLMMVLALKGRKEFALLVGINKYKYVRPLDGCVSDVCNMANILTSVYGFSTDEIRTIVDESATRNNLMNRLTGF